MSTALRLPTAPKDFGKTRWGLQLLPLICYTVANVIVTQEVARRFAYQPALGAPLWMNFYPPWAWMVWAYRYWSSFPQTGPVFQRSMAEVIGALFVGMIASRLLMARSTRKGISGAEDLHGSARWAKDEEIETMGLTGSSGPYIGAYEDQPNHLRYLRYPGDEHLFVFWPSRTGKTAGIVIPSLLSITDSSVLVLDPKDELHLHTSGYRSQFGPVFRFAPAALTGSRFNLFQEIRFGSIYDVRDAENIATMHCLVPGQESKDPHWDQIAAQLVTGVILHEGYKALRRGKHINGTMMANALTPDNFVSKLKEMLTFEHDPRNIMGWKDGEGDPTRTHPTVRSAANMMLNQCVTVVTNDEERLELGREGMAYLTNAQKRFHLYLDPLIQRATETSDFSIENLVNHEKPITLYASFPLSDEDRLKPLARVFFHLIFSRLTEPQRIRQRNRWILRLLMEEFISLGYMEIFDRRIADVAGFGLRFLLIAQNVQQVHKLYTHDQSITSNCGVRIAAAPNDTETAGEISRMTGTVTIQQLAASFSGDPRSATAKSMTTHVNYVKRELLTPDEAGRLSPPEKEGDRVVAPGDLLIFMRGRYPIKGRQLFYFLDSEFLKRSQLPEVTEWRVLSC